MAHTHELDWPLSGEGVRAVFTQLAAKGRSPLPSTEPDQIAFWQWLSDLRGRAKKLGIEWSPCDGGASTEEDVETSDVQRQLEAILDMTPMPSPSE